MTITDEQCIQCGGRHRSHDIDNSTYCSLSTSGNFMESPLWFCSLDCYKKAVRKYLDKRYDFDIEPADDPDVSKRLGDAHWEHVVSSSFLDHFNKTEQQIMQPHINAAYNDFYERKAHAIVSAEHEVWKRVYAEHKHYLMKLAEAEVEQEFKEEERQRKEEEKRAEQQRKEQERQRKIDEEEKAREAEEARWQPKPFDL